MIVQRTTTQRRLCVHTVLLARECGSRSAYLDCLQANEQLDVDFCVYTKLATCSVHSVR
jgi:hypothetical protein